MDTEDSVVKARGVGTVWRGTKMRKMGDISNSVSNEKRNKH